MNYLHRLISIYCKMKEEDSVPFQQMMVYSLMHEDKILLRHYIM